MILIPKPKKIRLLEGHFHLNGATTIMLDTACGYRDFEASTLLKTEINRSTCTNPEITRGFRHDHTNLIIIKKEIQEDSYRLIIDHEKIEITGCGSEGLYYGIQTLRQLIRINGNKIPCMEIYDSPAFRNRGGYHDITRGKVPRMNTLMELADRLSFYKINQLQLYIEHSFAFKAHSEVWSDSDPITAEEILIFDEYCKKRNIELIPSLSTFGHLYHALVSESYRHLNEFSTIRSEHFLWTDRQNHYTLDASNPASIKFVYDMVDEFLPLFTSDKFNIGCDETFDTGEDKSRELVKKIGKGRLYADFVNKVISHIKSYGKQVMMWGDIIVKNPDIIKEFPEDLIILNWDYNAEADEDNVKIIADSGLRHYVCPGVNGWNKLMNGMDEACKNIRTMVGYGVKYDALGVLNTDWGDMGHINLFSNSIPGMIYGAGLSWNTEESDENLSDEYISKLEYGDKTGRIVGLLRDLSSQPVLDWYSLVVWYYDMKGFEKGEYDYDYEKYHKPGIHDCNAEKVFKAYQRITEIESEILKIAAGAPVDRKTDFWEFYMSARGLALFQSLLLLIKKYSFGQSITDLIHEPQTLAEGLEYWLADYKSVWRERNKESELYRIKEVIIGVCKIIRTYGKKL